MKFYSPLRYPGGKSKLVPFQPTSGLSLDEQIVQAIKAKNAPYYSLDCDDDGNILVDKEKNPELYDWAMNG